MLMIATPHHIVQTSVQYGKEGDFMTSVKTSLIFALRCAKRRAGDYALRLRAVRVQAAAARAAADAYIAEKAAEFGIDQTEVNGSASSSAAVAETAEAAVAETAVAVVVETAVAETAETESAVVAVVAKTAVAAVVASTSAPTSATAGLSKRWRDVAQGRERSVVRPLAAAQNTQSLHFC